MSLAYAYPTSRFEPAVLVDLNSRAERERLSQSALKGFFKLAAAWQLRDEDARELLGGLSASSFYDWKKPFSADCDRRSRSAREFRSTSTAGSKRLVG